MTRDKPIVSVVVVNWNGLEDTKECLEYLKQQTYKNIETVVVDNGSDDGSLDYLSKLRDIILVRNTRNLGFTGGHIAGYKASQGEFVLLLNNDAIMDSGYISRAVSVMIDDDSIGALGGRAYLWDKDNPLFSTSNKFYGYQNINPINAEGIFTQHDDGYPAQVNNVSGSCVMVRRSVIDKIGYLYDPFFAYYEESDLFARMKRGGYKIIYRPDLAIWHANAKTSNKKTPTFSLYMMMRNRFRFAVRNFDSWSLVRFLKFYLIMGCASMVRVITDKNQRPMHKAYAKAFFYNIAFGIVPFIERQRLRKQLGKSDYNRLLIKEQSPVSVILRSNNKDVSKLAAQLDGGNEILLTLKNKPGLNLKNARHIRYCIDKGFLKARPENFSAVISKNNWLIITAGNHTPSAQIIARYQNLIYDLNRNRQKAAVISPRDEPVEEAAEILSFSCDDTLLIHKSEFIHAGGLIDPSDTAAYRRLLLYCFLGGNLAIVHGKPSNKMLEYKPTGSLEQFQARVSAEAAAVQKSGAALPGFITRHYRLLQLTNLLRWLASRSVSPRLKAARLKNLVVSAATFNRSDLALELRHIKNETGFGRTAAALSQANKDHEIQRLAYLKEHPEQTPVFIIVRDRLDMMKGLLAWLKSQGLHKIIFVDNDSLFPPLVKFLDKTEYQVLHMGRNTAQTGLWNEGIIRLLLPDDFYIVTDPDIVPTPNSPWVLKCLYELHQSYPDYLKVGLGLKIDDLPDHYPLKEQVVKWESQFWKTELQKDVFEAGVDTTFALYKPYTYSYFLHPSLRTGGQLTARHLPWYQDSKKLPDEEIFYRLRQDQSVSSWNVDELPERYKAELAKQR